MKTILNIALLFLILFSLSCENDKNKPKWLNFYDPDKNESDLEEICGTIECGEVEYLGHSLICGECTEEKYCSIEQKCVEKCGENSCGTVEKNTYSGIVPINCGTCADEEYCNTSLKCSVKEDECIGKCGTITVAAFEGDIEIECGGCTGEFAYCNAENICDEACKEKECGSEKVTLDTSLEKTFVCGECGGGMNYCGSDYKCKIACSEFECGVDNVATINGTETVACGECTSPDYCDSSQECKTGIVSGNFIIDDNIVIDTVNNFMWQKTNSEEMSVSSAKTYCNNLTIDGFKSWGLPDISMLKSIVSGCTDSETCGVVDTCTESTCATADCDGCANGAGSGPQGLYLAPDIWTYTGDANGRFWSSSSTPDKADSYWFVRFSNGSVTFNWDGSEYLVKCVRDLRK
jgi:hypothetical protein